MAMAKIRPIPAELWTDEHFVGLSQAARLLFLGMGNFACDNGHLRDASNTLKLRVLPADSDNVAELLRELDGTPLIERADGWITLPGAVDPLIAPYRWRIDMRYWKGCKKPGCEKPERETRRGPDEDTRGTRRDHATDGDGDGDGDVGGAASGSSAATRRGGRRHSRPGPRPVEQTFCPVHTYIRLTPAGVCTACAAEDLEVRAR